MARWLLAYANAVVEDALTQGPSSLSDVQAALRGAYDAAVMIKLRSIVDARATWASLRGDTNFGRNYAAGFAAVLAAHEASPV